MAGLYLDTSALGRVLLGEPDAETIGGTLFVGISASRSVGRTTPPSSSRQMWTGS